MSQIQNTDENIERLAEYVVQKKSVSELQDILADYYVENWINDSSIFFAVCALHNITTQEQFEQVVKV